MKKTLCHLFGVASVALVLSAHGEETRLGMVTGDPGGTYYQFGQDMRKVAAENEFELGIIPSAGSVENVLTLYDSRSVQLGIVQSDVTLFMNFFGDAKTKEIARDIKVIFVLYDEEVHLLAAEGIKQLSDLKERKVAIGKPGSGTSMTANLVLQAAEVKPAEVFEIGEQEAIDALRNQEIDALFYVAGHPISLFEESLRSADKFHLVPVTGKAVSEMFGPPSKIPASAYLWQDEDVETVTVKAGLMTLDYGSDDVNCAQVGRFAKVLYDNLDWLKQNGHEKWQSVDLDLPVHPALQSACALRALGR